MSESEIALITQVVVSTATINVNVAVNDEATVDGCVPRQDTAHPKNICCYWKYRLSVLKAVYRCQELHSLWITGMTQHSQVSLDGDDHKNGECGQVFHDNDYLELSIDFEVSSFSRKTDIFRSVCGRDRVGKKDTMKEHDIRWHHWRIVN
ncbi:hypothetical protein HAX54_001893, partial [Datura stramonium]|nr:hypothetical protein [Datura stramonium]